jgi:hypothetical protein
MNLKTISTKTGPDLDLIVDAAGDVKTAFIADIQTHPAMPYVSFAFGVKMTREEIGELMEVVISTTIPEAYAAQAREQAQQTLAISDDDEDGRPTAFGLDSLIMGLN